MIYVEQNPLRAALVQRAEQWKWSSARLHVSGSDAGFLDLVKWRAQHTPESWKRYLELGLADARIEERIREATVSGWLLGSESFLHTLESEHGLKVRPRKPPRHQSHVPAVEISTGYGEKPVRSSTA